MFWRSILLETSCPLLCHRNSQKCLLFSAKKHSLRSVAIENGPPTQLLNGLEDIFNLIHAICYSKTTHQQCILSHTIWSYSGVRFLQADFAMDFDLELYFIAQCNFFLAYFQSSRSAACLGGNNTKWLLANAAPFGRYKKKRVAFFLSSTSSSKIYVRIFCDYR